ncbi:D-cysteine desulfhydrase family protein [Pseudomonas frederiksbergensis]|uniref:D-cysteine desulfhydrase family protein n=1 Tax=Pseudomonas frederiksbergensis TaxID=104087 RepID=UPI003D1C4BB9
MKTIARLDIDHLPRISLLEGPTPIQRLCRLETRLGKALAGVRIYIKRDDQIMFAGGGNKVRKLEYLMGAALADGCDTIIATGGLQSNHARLTAAAAARVGIDCELVLGRVVPRDDTDYEQNGNILLDKIFGAKLHILQRGQNASDFVYERAGKLAEAGKKVAVIPMGGSSAVGALGYARCAEEILAAEIGLEFQFDKILIPNGSSGTHAGLAAGFSALGRSVDRVRSYSVLGEEEAAITTTLLLANGALDLLGCDRIHSNSLDISGEHRGAGYGIPTDDSMGVIGLLAKSEGILLDPVYSAKAFAGMLHDIRKGAFSPGSNLLFVHTGGTPGLYAYRSEFN